MMRLLARGEVLQRELQDMKGYWGTRAEKRRGSLERRATAVLSAWVQRVDPMIAARAAFPQRPAVPACNSWFAEVMFADQFAGRPIDDGDALLERQVAAWRAAAFAAHEALRMQWLWEQSIPKALAADVEPVRYPCRPEYVGTRLETHGVAHTAASLARLWAREAPQLLHREVAEDALRASGTLGRRVLWLAQRHDPAAESASNYGTLPDGRVVTRGTDGAWYTPEQAAHMIAEARPWTRAEIMEQYERDAEVCGLARQFHAGLAALIGRAGQGAVESMLGQAGVSVSAIAALQRQVPLLAHWVCQQLNLPAPAAMPTVAPLRPTDRAQANGHLLGAHLETEPDVVRVGPDANVEVLVHELAHWAITHHGARTMDWAAEETLADRAAAAYRRRGH